jgi:hypothetical protein
MLYDADTLSQARKSVNRITRFSNPSVMGANPVYATELNGEAISDPTLTSRAKSYASFNHVQLWSPGGPQMEDVKQGGLGDCWLASTAAAIAGSKSWVIKRAVVPLGDGTYMVKLDGKCFRVDADLPVTAGGSAAYASPFKNPSGALWFPLIEKAMASAVWSSGNSYKYSDVEGDWLGRAFDALGQSYNRYTLAEVPVIGYGTSTDEMFNYIKSNLGRAMTVATEPSWMGVGSALAPSHAYTVLDAWVDANGRKLVKLRNPWANSSPNGNIVTVGAGNLHDSCFYLYVAKS